MSLIPIAGAALSGLGGIAQSLIDRKTSQQNLRMEQDYNTVAAATAYARDVEMWNRQNEYNTPEAQMKRYSEAGLNPHLIYGQGTPGNASGMPNYQNVRTNVNTPSVNLTSAFNMLSQYQDLQIKSSQNDLIKEQSKVAHQSALTDALRSANIAANTENTKFQTSLSKSLRQNTIDVAKQNLRNMMKDFDVKDIQIRSGQEDIILKKWENKIKDLGVSPSSSNMLDTILRFMIGISDRSGVKPSEILKFNKF